MVINYLAIRASPKKKENSRSPSGPTPTSPSSRPRVRVGPSGRRPRRSPPGDTAWWSSRTTGGCRRPPRSGGGWCRPTTCRRPATPSGAGRSTNRQACPQKRSARKKRSQNCGVFFKQTNKQTLTHLQMCRQIPTHTNHLHRPQDSELGLLV